MIDQEKLRTVIIDDEPIARDIIYSLLETREEIEVIDQCTNGKSAVESIKKHKPDIIFLDVEMPDLDGFGVIKLLDSEVLPLIIFTTAYDQYAIPAFEANAVDYLLKPFDKKRFNESLNRAIQRSAMMNREDLKTSLSGLLVDYEQLKSKATTKYISKVTVRYKNKIRLIKTDDIQWIEASGDYVCIHSGTEKYLLNDSMNKMAAKLDPVQFIRIHRSTIINVDEVHEIEPYFNGEYFIYLRDGTKLKSSRSYKEMVSQLIL